MITEAIRTEGLRLAQAVSDFDRRDEETRRAGDNVRRLNRLTLGRFIVDQGEDADALVTFLAESTPATASELQDYAAVARFNRESGYEGWLTDEASMSFTINRTVAGRRVKIRKGGATPTIQQRIDALEASIRRNNGVASDDAEFRQALGILPPPNSLANIIERAANDPEFEAELAEKGVVTSRKGLFRALGRMHDLDEEERRMALLASFGRDLNEDDASDLGDLSRADIWLHFLDGIYDRMQRLNLMLDKADDPARVRALFRDDFRTANALWQAIGSRIDGSLEDALARMTGEGHGSA